MADYELGQFFLWSGVTAVLMIVTGLTYRIYLRKKQKISSS
jgi:hypothetical protein|tara:strand:+ start:679 stop:801 length:123 start_codon:yes stop_codon:yes gene_type:complete